MNFINNMLSTNIRIIYFVIFISVFNLTVLINSQETKYINNEKSISIIYAGNASGVLQACKCPSNPKGGLLRRITKIEELQKTEKKNIVIDTGDFMPISQNKLLFYYTKEMMKLTKYDVVCAGDQEFILGIDSFTTIIEDLPIRLDNLEIKKIWEPKNYYIKKTDDIKIGILVIIDSSTFVYSSIPKNVRINNPIATLKNKITKIKKLSDLIIVVAHCNDMLVEKIIREIKGIDVLIVGHSRTFKDEPVKIDNTLVVWGGASGDFVGKLKLKYDNNNQIIGYENTFFYLDSTVTDNAEGKKLIEEYNQKLRTYDWRHYR